MKDLRLTYILPKVRDIEKIVLNGLEFLGGKSRMEADKISQSGVIISEAILNALEHSQAEIEEIKVDISINPLEEISLEVKDYGQGFDMNSLPTLPEPETMEKLRKRGWGLTIMQQLSDHFEIHSNESGTAVKMIIKL